VIAARSKSGFEKQLSAFDSFEKSRYDVIDVKGEGWSFHPENMVISPLNMKKRWFKKEIIAMFNNRRNNFSDQTYSEKSISAKRFEIIFKDIVGLLLKNP